MRIFPSSLSRYGIFALVLGGLLCAAWSSGFAAKGTAKKAKPSGQTVHPKVAAKPAVVAQKVDELILAELAKTETKPAARSDDETFLRRVTFDLTGTTPAPNEVTLFGIDPDPEKRIKAIERLLASPAFAKNWAQYWREVIYSRATDPRSRLGEPEFKEWLTKQFETNQSWDKIATALLTATGDVREAGQTALMFAHQGEPEELAAESSRIFLGIQIQCANCHDHPSDKWKREQFHQLAAFFPRVTVRAQRQVQPYSFEVASLNPDQENRRERFQELLKDPQKLMNLADRDKNGKLTLEELTRGNGARQQLNRLFELGDADKDGALSLKELKDIPIPEERPGQGSAEHFMPDLEHPQDKGKKMEPVFFVGNSRPGSELDDMERREALAKYMTARGNPWFSKAYVNRIWAEMLGKGFYSPVDDIGPERTAAYPEVLEVLSKGFADSGYDMKWLFRVIANTDAYQRSLQARDPAKEVPELASAAPTRLRADQLFDAMLEVLGLEEPAAPVPAGPNRQPRSMRAQFNALFGFDPSLPQDEILGTVPQALFMMNNTNINGLIRAANQTRLGKLLRDNPEDKTAVGELYLLVLAREPSEKELQICLNYREKVTNRNEAFEDLMWSLLNSTEFQTKR